MKKTCIKILSVALCAVMVLGAAPLGGLVGLDLPSLFDFKAEAASYSGTCGSKLTWSLDTDTGVLDITGTGNMYSYSSTDVPWYNYRSSIKTVNIAYSVTTISSSAFYGCTGLTSVTIPDSVTTISSSAFYGCDSLTSVTIPDSVTTIGNSAFRGCTSLTSVTIPDSVTSIGYEAFYGCNSLTSVTIPDSVTTIGSEAFEYCNSLTSVTIGNSVTTIGMFAFLGCDSLTSITIPDSVTSIYERAFYNCDSLTNITVATNNKYYSSDSYGVLFNKDKTTLIQYPTGNTGKSYTIPDSVTTIGSSAFYDCDSLTIVTIPDSVTNIGSSAFSYCDSLTSVTIPDSVTTIGDSAFYDCDSLTSVTIGNGVTTIGAYAFCSCDSLTSVTIPDSVTSIGSYAFALSDYSTDYRIMIICNKDSYAHQYAVEESVPYMFADGTKEENTISGSVGKKLSWSIDKATRKLTVENEGTMVSFASESAPWKAYADYIFYAEIKYGCTNISDRAFYSCSNLRTVDIPYSVTSIGDSAFYGCTSLTSVTIPDSVTSIGYYAFEYCYSLTSVTIGNSVTSIVWYAFAYCTSLTSVTIGNSVTTIDVHAFYDCDSLTSVTIPDSVTTIRSSAFQSCDSLSTATIGSGVREIGSYAFANCAKFYDIYIYSKTCSINETSITINATIHGYIGSTAEAFADKYGYNFEPIVDNPCAAHTYTDACDTICDVCGAKREITHSYGEWTVTKEPTCNTPGTKQHVCSVCGYTQLDSVPMLDEHVYTDTCDPSCNVCGEPRDVNHSYGEWTVTKEPTCAQNGIKQHTCSVCGAAETDYIAKLTTHTYTDSCDTDCNVCGKSREASHSYGEWTVTKEPTCNTLGTKQHTCSVCGAAETDYVAKKPHTYTDADDTECDVCGQSKDENNTVLNTYGICGENLTWSLDENGTLTIEGTGTMYNFNGGDYIYVDSDTKQPVADGTEGSIEICRWNLHNDKIKELAIGEGVTAISAYAFLGCQNLEKVYVPDIVISIDPFAFDGCGKAAIVCKNGSFANAFAAQNGIKYILEDSANGTAFEIKNGMLLGYTGTAHNVVLPSDITFVGPDAFKANSTVEFVEIPYNVAKIYGGAFADCANLDGVVIPFTVTDIGKSAFDKTDATIYCYYNSYAHGFAVKNGIDYELITITLDTDSVNLFKGNSVTVNAEPSIVLASGVPIVWQSLNPDVATVDANGNITANNVGTATVTAHIEGTAVSNSIDVQVLAEEYTITWVVDSKETKQTYKLGDEITAPDAPAKSGYTFTGWDKTVPTTMPAENLTFTAQFELNVKEIKIKTPSTTAINYGETLVLQLEDVELPEGWRVEWSLIGNAVTMSVSEDGKECRVTSTASGNVTVRATVVDENGEPVTNTNGGEIFTDINIKSNANFWQKIVSFFKNLFRMNRIIY